MIGVLWRTAIAWGVLAVIFGALMLLWPTITVVAASVLFGAYLLVSGVVQVIAAFGVEISGGSRILLLISGALSVILAIMAFRHFEEGYGVWLLATWIGIGFVFQGISEVVVAASYRDLPGRGWQVFGGVVTVAAGIVTLAWPITSIVTLAQVTGAFLIVIGIMQIVKAIQLRTGANELTHDLGLDGRYAHQ
ncbi:HdeD family acid-resistance protein [Mycobacterium sp. UM_WGJ]|uniref:HdeD family acid-resistance protein n=1 Tax=Mycobacterium sp. UM_WGJ TaxID=1370120 RepID=UPI000466089C|nr:HdeD family acid-resistance protein [Mycobacterium sp. UM_WGJ]